MIRKKINSLSDQNHIIMMKFSLLYVDTEYCLVCDKFNTKISAQEPGTNVTINLISIKLQVRP